MCRRGSISKEECLLKKQSSCNYWLQQRSISSHQRGSSEAFKIKLRLWKFTLATSVFWNWYLPNKQSSCNYWLHQLSCRVTLPLPPIVQFSLIMSEQSGSFTFLGWYNFSDATKNMSYNCWLQQLFCKKALPLLLIASQG